MTDDLALPDEAEPGGAEPASEPPPVDAVDEAAADEGAAASPAVGRDEAVAPAPARGALAGLWGRARREWRRVARPVTAVTLVASALLALLAWATASPPGSSPDEDYHMGSIWCPLPVTEHCEMRQNDAGVYEVLLTRQIALAAGCFSFHANISGACVDGIVEAENGNPPYWTNRFDRYGSYPRGFYRFMHSFTGVGDPEVDVTGTVFTMRMVNAVLTVAVFGAALAVSTAANRRLLAYGGLIVAAPMIIYLLASINPTGWSITGVTAAWFGLHGYMTERERWRRNSLLAVAGVGALMGVSSRGDAGIFVAGVSAAVVLLHWDRFWSERRTLIAPALTFLLGAAGFLSAGQTGAVTGGMGGGGEASLSTLINNLIMMPALLMDAITGNLNWGDTPMQPLTRTAVTVLAGAMLLIGVRAMNRQKALSLFGLLAALVGIPLFMLQITGTVVGDQVQGRYVTPLLAVVMMTALWDPLRGGVERLSRTQAAFVFLGLVAGHSWALHTQMRRFITGDEVRYLSLEHRIDWWHSPIPPNLSWLLGSLAFAVLCTAFFWVGRRADALPASLEG